MDNYLIYGGSGDDVGNAYSKLGKKEIRYEIIFRGDSAGNEDEKAKRSK